MEKIFLFFATLLAFFIKGITGFGNTLVMSPMFSFVLSNRLITPVDLLFSIPTNAYIAWRERKNISLKIVVPLSLLLLCGIIPGAFLLKTGAERLLKALLGLVVIGLAVEMLTRREPGAGENKKNNPVFLVVIGILSGVLAGLYGISAPLVAYISRTTKGRGQFRANICFVFLVDNLFRLFVYLFNGILNKEAALLALLLSPAVVLGMLFGVRIDSKLSDKTVKKMVVGLLLASGAILIIKSFLS